MDMAVKIHHLNCGTMRSIGYFPFSTMPVFGRGKLFGRGVAVIHCLLVDSGDGLILVDAGYGIQDYRHPTFIVRAFNRVISLDRDEAQTAVRQVAALGYQPEDVKHIFLTHMHLDHSGGIADFPQAQMHVYEPEYEMAVHGTGLLARFYIDQHWAHGPDWVVHQLVSDQWHGLDCTPTVTIGEVEVFMLPMVGHTPGLSAVVIHLPDERWLIHAGDSYGYHGLIDPEGPFYPPYHRLFYPMFSVYPVTASMFKHDHKFRRLRRELGDRLDVFNAHDPHDYERLSGKIVS